MRLRHVDIDAQHLPEQFLGILRAMIGVVAGPAIAEADVQVTVRAEREMSAVVVRERLRDRGRPVRTTEAEIEPRRRIGDERIGRAAKPRHHRVAGPVREVDEEASARRVGRERESEQAALAAGEHRRAQVEKVGRLDVPFRTTRIRPACSTTNCTLRSSGSWTKAMGAVKPEA